MDRSLLILANDAIRQRAHRLIDEAPINSRMEMKGPKRTLEQNARFWAMLTDIASQVTHHGQTFSTDDWRLIFLDALKREMRTAPNLDGNGFVNLGRSSSDLTKAEFGDLMTLMEAYGAQHGVVFQAPEQLSQARAA